MESCFPVIVGSCAFLRPIQTYRARPLVAFYRRDERSTRNRHSSPVVIAFIGYRCPASSEAFPLRLPSPVYHVLTCIHRKRSHAPEETGAVTVIQSFGDCRNLAPQRSWDGLMTGRNLSPHSHGSSAACQAELLDSPMAASFIRSVNIG